MTTEHTHEHIPEEVYGVLPDEGVVELTDNLTGYMYEIELGGLTDIMGQVLDDLLEQSGGMPQNLKADDAFEHITQNQLAVTLAYHLGRLEGRSPQVIHKMMDEAIEKWGIHQLEESARSGTDALGLGLCGRDLLLRALRSALEIILECFLDDLIRLAVSESRLDEIDHGQSHQDREEAGKRVEAGCLPEHAPKARHPVQARNARHHLSLIHI